MNLPEFGINVAWNYKNAKEMHFHECSQTLSPLKMNYKFFFVFFDILFICIKGIVHLKITNSVIYSTSCCSETNYTVIFFHGTYKTDYKSTMKVVHMTFNLPHRRHIWFEDCSGGEKSDWVNIDFNFGLFVTLSYCTASEDF